MARASRVTKPISVVVLTACRWRKLGAESVPSDRSARHERPIHLQIPQSRAVTDRDSGDGLPDIPGQRRVPELRGGRSQVLRHPGRSFAHRGAVYC